MAALVLDTNVLPELARPTPSQAVIPWGDAGDSSDLVMTALTVAEVRAGVALLPEGRRKREVGMRMGSLLTETFAGYVLAFDAQGAAISHQHSAALATRNTANFADAGIQLISPWGTP